MKIIYLEEPMKKQEILLIKSIFYIPVLFLSIATYTLVNFYFPNYSYTFILISSLTLTLLILSRYASTIIFNILDNYMDEIHKKNNYIIHQWRQSLNSISLLTEAIKLKTTMKDISEKTLIKITSDIYRNLDFMEETADSFSNLFKPSKKREYVVVQKSISKVSSILLPQLNTYKIPIQTLGDNCTAFIIDNEFQQVVLNILCNSRDILISNKISNPRIDIIVIEETNYIVVKIYDNGGGIPQTILTHLFKNYMTTKKNEGSEIGLTISKEIIENSLKGYLSAQNWEEGTCFTITLPKKPDLLSEEI